MIERHESPSGGLDKSERYLARRENVLSMIALLSLCGLVFSYVAFVRAGSAGKGAANALPAALGTESKAVYQAKCSSCHGTSGGGGVGPKLAGGAVIATFADPVEQVRWVLLGSGEGQKVYERAGKTPKGGMPTFKGTISLTEVVQAVLFERQNLSGQPIATDAEKWAGLRALTEEFADAGVTKDEVDKILARIATDTGAKIAAG